MFNVRCCNGYMERNAQNILFYTRTYSKCIYKNTIENIKLLFIDSKLFVRIIQFKYFVKYISKLIFSIKRYYVYFHYNNSQMPLNKQLDSDNIHYQHSSVLTIETILIRLSIILR